MYWLTKNYGIKIIKFPRFKKIAIRTKVDTEIEHHLHKIQLKYEKKVVSVTLFSNPLSNFPRKYNKCKPNGGVGGDSQPNANVHIKYVVRWSSCSAHLSRLPALARSVRTNTAMLWVFNGNAWLRMLTKYIHKPR